MTDRFNDPINAVRKKYQADYMDSANTLFINSLNFVATNYEDTYATVEKLQVTVNKNHKS